MIKCTNLLQYNMLVELGDVKLDEVLETDVS